jgi:arylsulfatase A-like enzyme
VRTPHIDALAAEGLRFENFFCTSPVCSPARASLFTGRIPSQHGVHDWLCGGNIDCPLGESCGPDRAIPYLRGLTSFTQRIAENGYTCGFSGKWHLGDSLHSQHGFSDWFAHPQHGASYYRDPPMCRGGQVVTTQGYSSDIFTDNALRFLQEQTGHAQPFYLSLHFTAPHSPWGRPHHPAPIYDEYFRHCAFDSVPRLPMHPWQISSERGDTEARRRELLSGYFAAVTAMDLNVGRLLQYLDETGLNANTLLLFTSDNGMNMGHHGIYGKGNGTFPQNMYDTSVKVPMLIRMPGMAAGTPLGLYSHYDLFPTLMDLLHLPDPQRAERPGTSLAPLLAGKNENEDPAIVVYDEYGPVRMVRTRSSKYVHRYPYGPHELYDLTADPNEDTNLYGCDGYETTLTDLRARLEDWFLKYVDPAQDGAKLPVTGKGQFGLVGPAAQGKRSFVELPPEVLLSRMRP